MKDINTTTLVGRLARDSELKVGQNTSILSFSVAVNGYKENDVSFFNVKLFGKFAETMVNHLTKGKQIALTGYLHQNRWIDKEGNNKSTIEIISDSIQLVGTKKQENNNTIDINNDDDAPF